MKGGGGIVGGSNGLAHALSQSFVVPAATHSSICGHIHAVEAVGDHDKDRLTPLALAAVEFRTVADGLQVEVVRVVTTKTFRCRGAGVAR